LSPQYTFVFEEIASSQSATFGPFFEIYQAAFPIEDEREGVDAFEQILALNHDRLIQDRFGPYREVVAAVRRWDGGPVIGGHVFGMASGPVHRSLGIAASIQGIYSFLHPDCRGSVPIAAFAAYCRQSAQRVFGTSDAPGGIEPIFMEVNNPSRMLPEEIAVDRQSSGMDPSRRYRFWSRAGYSPLAVDYVQPRLREDADPIRYLDLFCSRNSGSQVPSSLLLEHLRSFLSVSVFKGTDADDDPDFAAMRTALSRVAAIGFVDPASEDQQDIRRRAQRAREEMGDARDE
jgi:hypothetical protein